MFVFVVICCVHADEGAYFQSLSGAALILVSRFFRHHCPISFYFVFSLVGGQLLCSADFIS